MRVSIIGFKLFKVYFMYYSMMVVGIGVYMFIYLLCLLLMCIIDRECVLGGIE